MSGWQSGLREQMVAAAVTGAPDICG